MKSALPCQNNYLVPLVLSAALSAMYMRAPPSGLPDSFPNEVYSIFTTIKITQPSRHSLLHHGIYIFYIALISIIFFFLIFYISVVPLLSPLK